MANEIDALAEARQALVGKLSDEMDPENAAAMVARFEAAVAEAVYNRDQFAQAAVAVIPGDIANPEGIADDAYLIADAMIRRRRIWP